jgi:hypothetical protein
MLPMKHALAGLGAVLNRVQLETRSASLPKPLGRRRFGLKSTGLKLDAD